MESPFCVGNKATGDGFVGREAKLEEFRRKLFVAKKGSISICGLPRIGKSSLVYKLLHDSGDLLEKRIIVAEADNLGRFRSFFAMWRWLASGIMNQLKKAGFLDENLTEIIGNVNNANDDYERLSFALETLFETLNEAGIKTIIYIDEFDMVGRVFKSDDADDTYYYFQFLRNLITDPRYNVSFIIVSRRSLEHLEERCCGGSVFHLAFDKQQLVGFSDDELASFRDVMSKYGIDLAEEQWEKLREMAGRSPYLLSIAANDLIIKKDMMSVEEILQECSQRYYDYFKELISLLQDEGYMNRMIQLFIGPKYDLLPQHVKELENRGYISVRDGWYETISKSFERYMLNLTKLDSSLDIWPLLTDAEKRLRLIVESRMRQEYGENWEIQIRDEYEQRCQQDPQKYGYFVDFRKVDSYRSSSSRYVGASNASFLNFIGISELSNIMGFYWGRMFADVFGNTQFTEWKYKFYQMARARDPLAHSNPEFLTPAEIEQTNLYCRELLRVTEGRY